MTDLKISQYAKTIADLFAPYQRSGCSMNAQQVQSLVKALNTIRAVGIELEEDNRLLEQRLAFLKPRRAAPVLDGQTGEMVPFPRRTARRTVTVNPDPSGGDAA